MASRVQMIRNVIHAHRAQGVTPVEIHMTKADVDEFVVEAGIQPEELPDTRSSLQRMMHMGDAPRKVLRFEGLTIVANEAFPKGAMILRPAQLMADPNWERHIVFASSTPQPSMPTEVTPWMEHAPAAEEEDTLGMLTQAGGVNPTTVLIKAMENLDQVRDVVVVRFLKSGNIDFCTTMNRYEIIGGLQEALGYVMGGQ